MDQAYCDALRFAIDYEHKGEEHYRSAAAKSADPFARKALTFLADEEVEHIRKIEDFNKHLLGVGSFDMSKECQLNLSERVETFIEETRSRAEDKSAASLSDIEVYDRAMKSEKQGFEMYSSVRDSSSDPQLKEFFDFLAKEEQVHYKLLGESKKYLTDPSYYFEESGGWIFS